jgi:hypothetical protein
MDYRRGRQSDERRRRVMLDDSRLGDVAAEADGEPAEEVRAKTARRGRSYPDDALASRQMRLTDLLPIRVWMILAGFAAIVLAAIGIHFAHLSRESLQDRFGASAYIFDVDQPGSLGKGLGAALVIGATLASFFIYSLRRHKMDDYRGHYGIWLWVALVLAALSLLEYTGAAGLLESLVERNAPLGLLSRLPLIVHTVVALGALLFLARLGAEMQRCRSALGVLAVLVGAVGCVVAIEAGWRPPAIAFPEELLAFHARLASRALLFVMLLVYGRYTRLDALGNIKVREKKPRKKATAATEKAATKDEKAAPVKASAPASVAAEKPVQRPQVTSAPVTKPAVITAPKPVLTLGGQKPANDDDEGEGGNGRLSRAERRRLKQLGRAA